MKRMMLAFATLTLLVLAPASNASAQLLAAKDGPIVYGHHHLNVTSADEAKKFWVEALGGVLTRVGTNNVEIIKFPNALLFMRAQKPSGGTKGSTVDHIGFEVKNLEAFTKRLESQGIKLAVPYRQVPALEIAIAFI